MYYTIILLIVYNCKLHVFLLYLLYIIVNIIIWFHICNYCFNGFISDDHQIILCLI